MCASEDMIEYLNTNSALNVERRNVPEFQLDRYTTENLVSWEDNIDTPGACSLQPSQKRALPNRRKGLHLIHP